MIDDEIGDDNRDELTRLVIRGLGEYTVITILRQYIVIISKTA